MKTPKQFETLAALARKEPAPSVDVADAVMLRLRRAEAPLVIVPPRWMWLTAAASLAAAGIFGVLGYLAWVEFSSPGVMLLQEFSGWSAI